MTLENIKELVLIVATVIGIAGTIFSAIYTSRKTKADILKQLKDTTIAEQTSRATSTGVIVDAAGDVVGILKEEVDRLSGKCDEAQKKLNNCVETNTKLINSQTAIIKLLDFLIETMNSRKYPALSKQNKLCSEHAALDQIMIEKIQETKKILTEEIST